MAPAISRRSSMPLRMWTWTVHRSRQSHMTNNNRALGRRPLRSDVRALQFRTFLKRAAAEADPPAATKFWTKRAPFPIRNFGNAASDGRPGHGDCTIASQAIASMRMERIETRRTPEITDEEVI